MVSYEDLRSFCMQRHEYILKLHDEIEKHKFQITDMKTNIKNLKT